MKLGLLLSALFHLAVILAGMVVLPAKWEDQETFEMGWENHVRFVQAMVSALK